MSKYDELNKQAEIMYRFVTSYSEYMKIPQDYGTGEMISMTDVHTLTLIADNPGITAKEIGEYFQRTKGLISQIVKRLEHKGYLIKKNENGNEKTLHLYVTESGQKLSDTHKRYDVEGLEREKKLLSKNFSQEDLTVFYEILRLYTDEIIMPDIEKMKGE